MRRKWKRIAWPALAVLALPVALAALWGAVWLFVSPVVEDRLEAVLERRFAGDVAFGSLHYLPPYWVVASDAVLRGPGDGDDRVEWIRVGSLRARLDRIPGTGPILIEKLTLVEPVVTLLERGGSLHDPSDLWRSDGKRRPGKLPLRRIVVRDLEVRYRSAADGEEPRAFGGFDLVLDADRGGERAYDFQVDGGGDRLRLDAGGRLALDDRTLRVAKLDAATTLGGAGGDERGTEVRLAGARGALELKKSRWRLDDGALTIGADEPLELAELRLTAHAERGRIEVGDLHAAVLDGSVDGSGSVRAGGTRRWSAALEARELDLARLARRFGDARVRGRLSGRASLSGPLAAGGEALLDGLSGDGVLRVRDGRLYEIPVIAALLGKVEITEGAATVSDARADVSVANRVATLEDLALASPAIGMQGRGEVGFDRRVDLDVVVVPLGDWKQKLEATDVPVVEGPIATIAGALQSLFGQASGMLYEFRVTGTLGDPSVVPVPAPVLTGSAARLFARMVSGSWQEDALSPEPPRRPDDAGSPRASRE